MRVYIPPELQRKHRQRDAAADRRDTLFEQFT